VPSGSYIKVNAGLHQRLYGVLGAAAKISALISERPRRKQQQSEVQHQTLIRRARWLRSLLAGLSLSSVTATKVRHTVEHFDEYLDDAARQCSNGSIPLPAALPVDMVVGHRDLVPQLLLGTKVPGATVYNLRVYVADERIFINCDKEIDVGLLHDECAAIQARLKPLLHADMTGDEERGSPMVILTPESFGRADGSPNDL
jgi:hypothetical protein